jgi:hypothetical protein
VNQGLQSASEALYKAAADKAQAGTGPAGTASGGDTKSDKKDEGPIIDAEVVDEKKS